MKPKKNFTYVISGVLLIIAAILLMKTPVYTSVKGFLINIGGNIGLAVGVAMGLIILVFVSGMMLIRKT